MESAVNIADGGSAGGSWGSARNSYIGLAGDWGTFLYGRHDTPYKMAYYASGIDMLGDSFMDSNALYGHQEWRRDNAIAYVSPNWNGLTFAAAVIPAEGDPNPQDDSFADSYSLGVMYSNNGIKLSAGYEDTEGEVGEPSKNWMLGAGWSGNNFDISAVYVDQKVENTFDLDGYAVSAAYTWGNNKFIGTVGQSDWGTNDGLGYGVAVQHMFSKRTSAYLGYSESEMLFAHKTQTGASYDYRGVDSEAVSFGMIHKF
jgi:predicted porin